MNQMNKLLEIAIIAAIEAGEKIMEIYATPDFGIEMKVDQSPLTLADKAAHEAIFKHLITTGIPILSEEGQSVPWNIRKKWNLFWLVDPLDGTKEFIKKNGEFTVNIALIKNCTPVMGVIVVPVSGELYYANNKGSFKSHIVLNEIQDINSIFENSTKLPSPHSDPHYVVVGSRSHLNPETEKFINNLETNGKPLKMVTKGSSLKLCLVASGEADIYPRLGPTMEWDIAAGHAIALFAGKNVSQISSGKPLKYNKENLLNPHFVVK
jgi:3'(2'), 5'-bisphosphate nucleotidase